MLERHPSRRVGEQAEASRGPLESRVSLASHLEPGIRVTRIFAYQHSKEPQAMSKHPIAGSDKSQPEGARCVGACNPDEKIEVVVMLRRQNEDAFRQLMQKINTEIGRAHV